MIIYHTTFHMSDEAYPKGLDYLKTIYVPKAICSGKLNNPRIQRVIDTDGEMNGVSLSVQFRVTDKEALNDWMEKEGFRLYEDLKKKFNDEILSFSTLLEEIDI